MTHPERWTFDWFYNRSAAIVNTAKTDNEPAFPRDHRNDGHNGMSLRDYFAAKAMQGLMDAAMPMPEIAVAAYQMADAMMKARNQ